ncbi:type I methionyl aminopeptidase [Mycoplasma iguanae]|uniref:Methionine aminopeptidase n=1 Tax=Mycoplasma iguanae TaxID=292461 RepID=A0ABY5R9E9_9MOLU|nr:type I methionyl aminopeptidase [Mycoplasma iguanae]UVD81797.1 type I methionyl aminopeptidase [Mycoplasma iguanae]
MISIKNAMEIAKITKSCEILAQVKEVIYDLIKPGISLKELDTIAFKEIKKRGGEPAFLGYYGFPATICASLNEELIHGIPDNRTLQEGDIISIDMGVIYEGYYSDSAFTKGVGKISQTDQKLIDVAKNAFYAGLNAIKPGARIGDIEHAIGQYIKNQGLYTTYDFAGHGIGRKLHEDPTIFNDGIKGKGALLRDGMVICIEPMILQDSSKTFIKKDGWTVVASSRKNASHYEHTILIKDGYPIVLTGGI